MDALSNSDSWAQPTAGVEMVVADAIDVTYRVYEDRRPQLRDLVRQRSLRRRYREIEAVRGVTFSARAGEVVGVVGRNGSGKSTLLRALAGLLPVQAGAVYARGQPALLGVGAALQGNLSGRRNIILGGLALGLSRQEVTDRFDGIVEFAGLANCIDLPLRTYSSGMRARLHFAIASAVEPDVLLIDEALAVGDEEFQARSEERIGELRARAGAVVLVSHSGQAIRKLCTRAVWMDGGAVMADGLPKGVLKEYRAALKGL